jgi:hypothetical protein
MKIRMNVYLPRNLSERLDGYALRFGLTKSMLVTISVQAGLDAIVRALAPEDALTTEKWAEILAAASQREAELEKITITNQAPN